MKILTFSHLQKKGGKYYTHYLNGIFFNQLVGCFEKVYVCAITESKKEEGFDNNYELGLNIEIAELGEKTGLWGLLSIPQAKILLRTINKVDYLHLVSGTLSIKAYLLNKLTFRKRFCVYERGYWLDHEYIKGAFNGARRILIPIYKPTMISLRKLMLKDAHMVYVHGKKLFRECIKIKGFNVKEVVPLVPLSSKDFYFRKDTCGNINGITILYVGGISRKKGIEYLLEAFYKLRSMGYKIRLKIVTKVKLLTHQDAMLDKFRIRDFVEVFVGVLWPEVLKIYRLSDILVVPSLSEGFPRVLYEGMSQCIPIVTTGVGGITGLMKDSLNAIIIEPYSSDEIINGVRKIIEDEKLRRNLIKNGLMTVREIFSNNTKFKNHAEQIKFYAQNDP